MDYSVLNVHQLLLARLYKSYQHFFCEYRRQELPAPIQDNDRDVALTVILKGKQIVISFNKLYWLLTLHYSDLLDVSCYIHCIRLFNFKNLNFAILLANYFLQFSYRILSMICCL